MLGLRRLEPGDRKVARELCDGVGEEGLRTLAARGTESSRAEICLGNATAGLLASEGEDQRGKYLK